MFENIKNNIEQILEHYPEEKHALIKHQIITMIDFIASEKGSYISNEDVKKIMNNMLSKVIEGEFIL